MDIKSSVILKKKDRYELLGFRLLRFVTCVFGDILGVMSVWWGCFHYTIEFL